MSEGLGPLSIGSQQIEYLHINIFLARHIEVRMTLVFITHLIFPAWENIHDIVGILPEDIF